MRNLDLNHVVSSSNRQAIKRIHTALSAWSSLQTVWGWLPELSVICTFGLLLVAVAYTGARLGSTGLLPLFWLGILIIYIPITVRIASHHASRRERIGLVILLGLGLYIVKVLHDPAFFGLPDEFMHWRTVNDLIQSKHLFRENPILPISPLYPGLEIVTGAFANLSGLPLLWAGRMLVGIARLLLLLPLYLLYEQISGSPRTAGIASVMYMTTPDFMYFDAQFAYESLALPLAVWVVWSIARRGQGRDDGKQGGFTLAILLGIVAVVVTHHITSYFLSIFLALWTLVSFWKWLENRRNSTGQSFYPLGFAGFALISSFAWLAYTSDVTVDYLFPMVIDSVVQFIRLLGGKGFLRDFFVTSAGYVSPLWERILGFASVGLILSVLPVGLLQIWRRYREKTIAVAFALGAIGYPASLAIGLTSAGSESAHRSWPFLFIPLAFVLAVGVVEVWESRLTAGKWSLAFIVWATILFAGGMISGWPTRERLPGSYLVGADARSIEQQGITAAEWARGYLGTDNRMIGDRTNLLLMGSLGGQHPVRSGASQIFFTAEYGQEDQAYLDSRDIRYVIFDQRLSLQLPEKGIYIETYEPGAHLHSTPLDPRIYQKFDGLPGVIRLFDSGEILIYDIEALSNEP
jgi:hypothetical protein